MKYFDIVVDLALPRKGFDPIVTKKCRVGLAIDEHAIARMLGTRALCNKSKQSKDVGGRIVASVHIIGEAGNVG
jgi:hypothetical protein